MNTLELIIDGFKMDLGTDSIDIKMSHTLLNPEKLTYSPTSYSYSFNLPMTPDNCKHLGNINSLAVKGKFNRRYKAELYSNSLLIFDGEMKISSISDGKIKCNLYINKANTIDTIFGDSKLSEISWNVPFSGITTINEINNDLDSKYYFPFVAYNLFNKNPYYTTDAGFAQYSDKNVIDNTCHFYYNSFVPSLNMVETLRKCFEYKGLKLDGTVNTDKVLNEVFLSNYIDNSDDPAYNLGNPDIGEVGFNLEFRNWVPNGNNSKTVDGRVVTTLTGVTFENQSRYNFSDNYIDYSHQTDFEYNNTWNQNIIKDYNVKDKDDFLMYDSSIVYNILNYKNLGKNYRNYFNISNVENNSNLLVNGGIQIPQDGWYEISYEAELQIDIPYTMIRWSSWWFSDELYSGVHDVCFGTTGNIPEKFSDNNNTWNVSIMGMPIELQWLKFDATNNDAESICHDPAGLGVYPNEADKVMPTSMADNSKPWRYTNTRYNGLFASDRNETQVDPSYQPNFLMGMQINSSWGDGLSYMKNGKSIDASILSEGKALYNCHGYNKFTPWNSTGFVSGSIHGGSTGYERESSKEETQYHFNELQGFTDSFSSTGGRNTINRCSGKQGMIVYLEKNTVIAPFLNIQKFVDYDDSGDLVLYPVSCKINNFKLRAVAPKKTNVNDLRFGMTSLFPTQLNLANFFNSKQKISEYINNVIKAFNLSYERVGDVIYLNTNKLDSDIHTPLLIDGKCTVDPYEEEPINWPSNIQVKYKVDTEEEGFYLSVPYEHLEDDDWVTYGDYGSEKVELSQLTDASALTLDVAFSNDWLKPFKHYQYVDSYNNPDVYSQAYTETDLMIPVIGKSEWWINGYKYTEMAKNDGRSMAQRFWFRELPKQTSDGLNGLLLPVGEADWHTNKKRVDTKGNVGAWYRMCIPILEKEIDGKTYKLTYNNEDDTILTTFFNTKYNTSDQTVIVEAWLSPQEYYRIVNGGMVQFNSDVYRVLKINSYNAYTGKAKLTLLST